jgi:hypothetical protein
MEIIIPADLASWLREPDLAADESLNQIVSLTNELITEEWAAPEDPIPTRIRILALNVASRAWVRNPAHAHLESITRTLDDASRTERYKSSTNDGTVYLTDSELAVLHGKPAPRSVRLVAYGEYE